MQLKKKKIANAMCVGSEEEANKRKDNGERESIQEPESPSWESVGTSVQV